MRAVASRRHRLSVVASTAAGAGARLLAALTALALGALVVAGPGRADAHPVHSTITELTTDETRGAVRATVRLFADDLRAAVLRSARGREVPSSGPAWDSAVLEYATSTFALQDARGRGLTLRGCGVRRTADHVWLCLEADLERGSRALRVRNAMLCELFEDQVNVVRGTVRGVRRNLLFVRGDGFKTLF